MIMHYKGSCSCNRWQVEIEVTRSLEEFNPRVCDCNYCQNNPSEIISDPNMIIEFVGGETSIIQNGDQLANFYYCNYCGDFLAVGCNLNGQLHGAVNSNLLHSSNQLGKPIKIQPWLLNSDEKLDRWGKLWGVLNGV
jgi:hypothetical protein